MFSLLLSWLAWFVALFCGLYYGGRLSITASVILSAALAEIFGSLRGRKAGSSSSFTPHHVLFVPNVGKMLLELELLTPEEWSKTIQGVANPAPWTGDYLARHGRIGYALFQNNEQGTVVHWPKLNFYTDEFGFDVKLEFVQVMSDVAFLSGWQPECFARRGRGVMEFGISVQDSWWKANKEKIEGKGILRRTEVIHHFGRVNLIFEELPMEIFWRYYRGREKETSYVSKALEAKGWESADRTNDEFWMHSPSTYSSPNVQISTNYLRDAGR